MKLFNKYKKRCLAILLTGFVLLFIFLLIISFGPRASEVPWAWGWLLLIYLPPLITLFQIKETRLTGTINGLEILFTLFVLASILVIWGTIYYVDQIPFKQPFILSTIFLVPLSILLVYLVRKNILRPIKQAKENELILEEPKVFLSYNHKDSVTALKIKDTIEKAGVPVIIDIVDMKAGEDIKEFIQSSLKEATAIVSLVSNRSLESAWVAKETIDTLFLETYMENKRFIACYLDDDFFQNDYTLKTVAIIDLQIKEVQDLIEQYHDQGIDTRDLNNQKSRLMSLRNGLDGIIGRLRDSLCLDVRKGTFEGSLEKLIEAIKSKE